MPNGAAFVCVLGRAALDIRDGSLAWLAFVAHCRLLALLELVNEVPASNMAESGEMGF